jgi:hypothetical protein
MSLVEKLKGTTGKSLVTINEIKTEYGDGFRGTIVVGNNAQKSCTLIRDKATGTWKQLGDEGVCDIVRNDLALIGTPIQGASNAEKIKLPEETSAGF